MVTSFEFATATRLLFGKGRAEEAAPLAKSLGHRVLVVTGRNATRSQRFTEAFRQQQLSVTAFTVAGEPTVSMVIAGADLARSVGVDVVVSIGGGSVIDAGKAIAALATNRNDVFDYLEVVGKARPITEPPLPFIAIPTTAGTGAEVTRNAVLHSAEHRVKVSLRSPLMLARAAVIDPQLTHELPPPITASTGMDALTQLIEPFVCKRANPITDAICRAGIPRVARSLRQAFQDGADAEARADMALASLLGGLALANAGLGAVHGFAAPLGGMFSAPHGALCAALLPSVMAANLTGAREAGANETLQRYTEIAQLLGAGTTADAAVNWVRELCQDLKIPRLAQFGITEGALSEMAARAAESSSMKGNPVAFTQTQLAAILQQAL